MSELYNGIAIIIDDMVKNYNELISGTNGSGKDEQTQDEIFEIAKKISEKNIPFLTFNTRPNIEVIKNFNNPSFVLLDWKLYSESADSILDKKNAELNIELINNIIKEYFVPIFIFSNENIEDIKEKLIESSLYYKEEEKNFIFIQKKKELINDAQLFNQIDEWITHHPALYTLKKWEQSLFKSKNESFWNLFHKSPFWPKVLWESAEKDNVEPSNNLYETINKTIKARIRVENLDEKIIKAEDLNLKMSAVEIMDVMRGIMFIEKDHLNVEQIKPGDIFKMNNTPVEYYINLRPECDTVKGRTDGYVYLIKGAVINNDEVMKKYKEPFGIIDQHNEAAIVGLDNETAVLFKFKKMKIMKYADIKADRICRLIPPYSNFIVNKYYSYMSRVGLPRYPDEIIEELVTAPVVTK